VYPEVEQLTTEAGYSQRKLLYKNLRNGRFEDVSLNAGSGISTPSSSRGAALGDFDNDGDIDVVVNCVNDYPQLLRCDSSLKNNWIKIRTIGTKSNRSGIGARLRCVTHIAGEAKPHQQIDEVRSGGGYFFSERFARALRHGLRRKSRCTRNPLAQRPTRYSKRSKAQPPLLCNRRPGNYPHRNFPACKARLTPLAQPRLAPPCSKSFH